MRIEFRADAANVFNHKSLGIPGGRNLGSTAGVDQAYTSSNTISSVTYWRTQHATHAALELLTIRNSGRDGDSSPSLYL